MEEMVTGNEDKAQFIIVWKKTCICAHTCTSYNKRLSSTKGFNKSKNKRDIIMKAMTYRINLYTSIGKFSFDMPGERRGGLIIVQS
jgi:hypothetical protein